MGFCNLISFIAIKKCKHEFMTNLFKMFMSLKCRYNKLQFGTRISSFKVSKQKPPIAMSLYFYTKPTVRKLGAPPFSAVKEFRAIAVQHRCLCILPMHTSYAAFICSLPLQPSSAAFLCRRAPRNSSQDEDSQDGSCDLRDFYSLTLSNQK